MAVGRTIPPILGASETDWSVQFDDVVMGFEVFYPSTFYWKVGKKTRKFSNSTQGWNNCWTYFCNNTNEAGTTGMRLALERGGHVETRPDSETTEEPLEAIPTDLAAASPVPRPGSTQRQEPVKHRYCPSCGTASIEGASFCGNCGMSLLMPPSQTSATGTGNASGRQESYASEKRALTAKAPPQTSGLAIASLVLGLVPVVPIAGSILAIVFGNIARRQIDDSHGAYTGRGMAVAGIILGWICTIGYTLLLIVYISLIAHG